MPESVRCFLILLQIALSRLSSGTETKHVCQGDYVQLFQNITFANFSTVNIYIQDVYKTVDRESHLCSWHSDKKQRISSTENVTLHLDDCGTISIQNIQYSEQWIYILQKDVDTVKSKVRIYVMVAPTMDCKVKIKKHEHILTASLEEKDCGKPPASVHWLDHPDITFKTGHLVQLTHENETGTYYACVNTPALSCVRNLSLIDYCTNFTVQGNMINQGTNVRIGKDQDITNQGKDVRIGKDQDYCPRDLPETSNMMTAITGMSILTCVMATLSFALIIYNKVTLIRRIQDEMMTLRQIIQPQATVTHDRRNPQRQTIEDAASAPQDEMETML